jgi:hypothetical protein
VTKILIIDDDAVVRQTLATILEDGGMFLKPMQLPQVEAAGMNAIHFGIIMAVNLSIGMYSAPFGLSSIRVAGDLRPAARLDLSRRRSFRADHLCDTTADQLRAGDLAGARQSGLVGPIIRRLAARRPRPCAEQGARPDPAITSTRPSARTRIISRQAERIQAKR